MARHQFEFLDWFEGIVVSGEERIAKPDEAIFGLMIERYHLYAGTDLYIDDSGRTSSRREGLASTRPFQQRRPLRQDLRARDLVD